MPGEPFVRYAISGVTAVGPAVLVRTRVTSRLPRQLELSGDASLLPATQPSESPTLPLMLREVARALHKGGVITSLTIEHLADGDGVLIKFGLRGNYTLLDFLTCLERWLDRPETDPVEVATQATANQSSFGEKAATQHLLIAWTIIFERLRALLDGQLASLSEA